MVGVRVARREGVLVGPIVFVAVGEGLAVAVGLNAREVGLFCITGKSGSAVGERISGVASAMML